MGKSLRELVPYHSLALPRNYQHPRYAFLNRYGSLQTETDVFHYVDFLRESARLDCRPPVDFKNIFGWWN